MSYTEYGAIAQLGERNTGSVEVSGSIPLSSTKPIEGTTRRGVPFLFSGFEPLNLSATGGRPDRSRRFAKPVFYPIQSLLGSSQFIFGPLQVIFDLAGFSNLHVTNWSVFAKVVIDTLL